MKVKLNGKEMEAGDMTILELARKNGIRIPTLCYKKEFGPEGRCRVCVVEADGKLVTSCNTRLKDGMSILTDSERVQKSRNIAKRLIGMREKRKEHVVSDEPIVYNPSRCVLCKACVKACGNMQTVSSIGEAGRGIKTKIENPFDYHALNSPCTFCGQCIAFCDRNAITERDDTAKVVEALRDKSRHVIVQAAPSIRASLGEMFGMAGGLVTGKMASALRKLGFDKVFDTDFAADLTTVEETHEFLERLEKKRLPHLTSCCPAWIRFAEYYYPELLGKISTTKSPHMMLGSLVKTYYAKKQGIKPKDIMVVSIMPCTAKKFEITRKETFISGMPNVDAVLTTRELGNLMKSSGIDLAKMKDGSFDEPLGISSGGAAIYGVTGGVAENVLRSASFMLGKKPVAVDFQAVRGLDGIKEAEIVLAGKKISVAAASGLGNIRKLLESMKSGKRYDIMELMACPGGCINGGGQPFSEDHDILKKRADALFRQDMKLDFRIANENLAVKEIYGFLGKPLGAKAEKILHTGFSKRRIEIGK